MKKSRQVPTLRVLRRARRLVSNPKTWARGSMARDAHGDGVPIYSPAATSWCLVGALWKSAYEERVDRWLDALTQPLGRLACRQTGEPTNLMELNDSIEFRRRNEPAKYGRRGAVRLLDAAIAELVQKGAPE